MNFGEIENVVNHIHKTCKCMQCNSKYEINDIHVVATTLNEGLFETRCKKCKASTIVTVLISPEVVTDKKQNINGKMIERKNGGISKGVSKNDILDMKNFLNKFDGNFKKLFINVDKK